MHTNTNRFLANIDKVSAAPCWLWAGAVSKRGYGIFRANFHGQNFWRAHRFSWAFHNDRAIPQGLVVCHSCDNPRCVNPDHLRADTQASNNAEAIVRGRWKPNVGTQNGRAIVSPRQVQEIRTSADSQMVLAKRYGIAQGQVSRIIRGENWTHIQL